MEEKLDRRRRRIPAGETSFGLTYHYHYGYYYFSITTTTSTTASVRRRHTRLDYNSGFFFFILNLCFG